MADADDKFAWTPDQIVIEEPPADDAPDAVEAAAIMEPDIVFTTARIRGVTLCDIPAFTEARIEVTGPADGDGMIPWAGVIAMEDTPTGDGRVYAGGSFRWEDDALGKIRWDIEDDGAHMGAVATGQIRSIERQDGGRIWGTGVFDSMSPQGAAAALLTERGTLGGVSVDMDDIPEETVEFPEEDEVMPEDDIEVIEASAHKLPVALTFPAGTSLQDIREAVDALHAANTGPLALDLTAAASGQADLPLAEDGTEFDPDTAKDDLVREATNDDGSVDVSMIARACLWLPDMDDVDNPDAYRLPFARMIDGDLTAVPAGIDWASAEAIRLNEAGELSDEDLTAISDVLTDYYDRMADDGETGMVDEELEASAWGEFRQMPALPALAFADPELAEVNEYVHIDTITAADGKTYQRMSGWVGQNSICHDAYSECITVPLAGTDLATFNRQPVLLDDGTEIMAGAFTMHAGHDNDGANTASMKAQFDDTRTVAGIVRVGLKADGSGCWFSGVMAPWLSDWDMQVLAACRPSGHWKRTNSGRYSLRAVLSVPVPGFPNRVAASAVVERSNMTLAASAAMAEPATDEGVTIWGPTAVTDGDRAGFVRLIASAVADELETRAEIRAEVEALSASLNDERKLVAAAMTGD